jgi:hypothetical protein
MSKKTFFDYWLLIFILVVIFLISVTALLVALLSYKRPVSSDFISTFQVHDNDVSASLSSIKTIYLELNNLKGKMSNGEKIISHLISIVENTEISETKKQDLSDFTISGNNYKVNKCCFTKYTNVNGNLFNFDLHLETVETGVSDASISINLEKILDFNHSLNSTASIVSTSTNLDDCVSWNSCVPEINKNTIVLNNSNWFVTKSNKILLKIMVSTSESDFETCKK